MMKIIRENNYFHKVVVERFLILLVIWVGVID